MTDIWCDLVWNHVHQGRSLRVCGGEELIYFLTWFDLLWKWHTWDDCTHEESTLCLYLLCLLSSNLFKWQLKLRLQIWKWKSLFLNAPCWFRFPLSLYLDVIQYMCLCVCCFNTCWLDPSRHVLKQHWPADSRHTASQDQSARAWGGNWSWSLGCLWLCWPPLCHSRTKSECSSTCTHIHIYLYDWRKSELKLQHQSYIRFQHNW